MNPRAVSLSRAIDVVVLVVLAPRTHLTRLRWRALELPEHHVPRARRRHREVRARECRSPSHHGALRAHHRVDARARVGGIDDVGGDVGGGARWRVRARRASRAERGSSRRGVR